jgi:uncharacterized protein (DUF2236 family)
MRDKLIEHQQYITRYGDDMPEVKEWCWPRPAHEMRPEPAAIVTEADLERELAIVCSVAAGSPAGVFGSDSVIWGIDREAAIFLAAGRAMLLQLAHPWVSAAITQHSRTLTDPIGRFHRTFNVVFTMVFGATNQAVEAARRLHRRHAAISGILTENVGAFAAGSSFRANDVAALRWVHATLTESALVAYQLLYPPLSLEERERYYAEARLFGAFFGIPQSAFPQSRAAFAEYVDTMFASDILAVSGAARTIAAELLSGAGTGWRIPLWYRTLTARLLPPRLRDEFGLPYGPSEHRRTERALAILRHIYPLVPARLRCVAPYHEARARLAGRARPGALTQILNRFWIGQKSMVG